MIEKNRKRKEIRNMQKETISNKNFILSQLDELEEKYREIEDHFGFYEMEKKIYFQQLNKYDEILELLSQASCQL